MQLCKLIWPDLRTLCRVHTSIPALKTNELLSTWCVDVNNCIMPYSWRDSSVAERSKLWLTDKPRLLLFCFSVLFHMYEALQQTQNKLFWFCFGFVLELFCFSCKSRFKPVFCVQMASAPCENFVLRKAFVDGIHRGYICMHALVWQSVCRWTWISHSCPCRCHTWESVTYIPHAFSALEALWRCAM